MAWEFKDKNLTNKLHELGLVEDEMGYWFYPPYSNEFWIISSYGDSISMIGGFTFQRGKVIDDGLTAKYAISDIDLIMKKVKNLNVCA